MTLLKIICIIFVLTINKINKSYCDPDKDETQTMTAEILEDNEILVFLNSTSIGPRVPKDSERWRQYYECKARLVQQLVGGQVGSDAVMVFEAAMASIPCRLCIPPGDVAVWMYKESINENFKRLQEPERYVSSDKELRVYRTGPQDTGVYQCRGRDTNGTTASLELESFENYSLVKPATSRGPYESGLEQLASVSLFTSWSQWSQCSHCDHVGRRTRHGICTVILKEVTEERHKETYDVATLAILGEYPRGMPCRSKYLPEPLKNNSNILGRPSEIMIGMCKVPCNYNAIFEVRSWDGRVIERANNSAGVFSLLQELPPQPPLPVNDILFVKFADKLVVRCPGTTLRDVPVIWHVGSKLVEPYNVYKESGGRVYIDARDRLVITSVAYDDGNLYRCKELDRLAGRVRVIVEGEGWWRAGGGVRWLMTVFVVGALVGIYLCSKK